MEETKVRYPIGQQDFKTLRERGLLCIDKTAFVDKIVNDGGQYFFLARPRRFGKSLFPVYTSSNTKLANSLKFSKIKVIFNTHFDP